MSLLYYQQNQINNENSTKVNGALNYDTLLHIITALLYASKTKMTTCIYRLGVGYKTNHFFSL